MDANKSWKNLTAKLESLLNIWCCETEISSEFKAFTNSDVTIAVQDQSFLDLKIQVKSKKKSFAQLNIFYILPLSSSGGAVGGDLHCSRALRWLRSRFILPGRGSHTHFSIQDEEFKLEHLGCWGPIFLLYFRQIRLMWLESCDWQNVTW